MHPFFIALQFLTRIPVLFKGEWQEKSIAQSVLYYPLVGLVLGAVLWLSAFFLCNLPSVFQAAVLLLIWVMLTGGLHLDGLADSADAWAGGNGDKQRSMEIMKDPAAGPLAVVVLILLLLIKFSALIVLVESEQTWGLIVATLLGRLSILVLFLTTPYVRQHGLGDTMAKYLNRQHTAIVVLITLLLGLAVFPVVNFLLIVASCVIVLYVLHRLMMQRLQGMTGDTIGASLEIIEAMSLFSLVLLVG